MRSAGNFALGLGASLAIALALVGCGGGSEATSQSVPRLTKARLAKELGNICQEHTDRQVIAIKRFEKKHHLPASSQGKASPSQLQKELVVVILPIVRDNIHDLEKLHPPQAQEADFKAFLGALEHGIAYSERDPSWILDAKPEPFSKARELSAKLGTPLCGQA